jgi:hypothetical protein
MAGSQYSPDFVIPKAGIHGAALPRRPIWHDGWGASAKPGFSTAMNPGLRRDDGKDRDKRR